MEAPQTLVVFDFDRSLCEDFDSDELVVHELLPNLNIRDEYIARGEIWPTFIDYCCELAYKGGSRQLDFDTALGKVELPERTGDLLRLLRANGCEVVIISDANTYWISKILEGSKMSDLVSATITNGALFDETGRLRVSSYHDITKPHGCVNLCKANMCKGLALSKIRKPSHSRVCYVGDGQNDFCPCSSLKENDVIFSRDGYPLGKALAERAPALTAKIVPWKSHLDIIAYCTSQLGFL